MKKILAMALVAALSAPGLFDPVPASAALGSLKTVPVPAPLNLGAYVRDKAAAIRLGKALFWDMQLGSDGVQACASCHFHAGADDRNRNQLNPGLLAGDTQFGNNLLGLPAPAEGFFLNRPVRVRDFPFHKVGDQDRIGEPEQNPGNVLSDTNDVMSSMGVVLKEFVDIVPGSPVELGAPLADDVFNSNGRNLRRVAGRNAPSVINAVFTFTQFWDGRANNIFNGRNPFGPADPTPHALIEVAGSGLQTAPVVLRQSSLASQAVGPPLSDFEMSWRGRTWPKIGKKMLSLKPLGQQRVHPADSVLGPLADNAAGVGLNTTYAAMIQEAFPPRYWRNTTQKVAYDADGVPAFLPGEPENTDEYTQMEANFSLFFGLAVQLYEATLVADDSPFDRFMEGSGALTQQELRGMALFDGVGSCGVCHVGPEFTGNSVALIQGADPITGFPQPLNRNPLVATEFMSMFQGSGLYDVGFYNIGVRPGGSADPVDFEFLAANEDIGRGGDSPFAAADPADPAETFPIPLAFGRQGMWREGVLDTTVPVPASLSDFIPPFPVGFRPADTFPLPNRTNVFGALKTPALRNVELTGPYFHNGGAATLRQVVDFYVRGGDFPATNAASLDPAILPIGLMLGDNARKNELVAFLLTLTDERVRLKTAPFDHPEIFVPVNGTAPESTGSREGFLDHPKFRQIPAVGMHGLQAEGQFPLGPFLGANPFRR